MSKKIHTSLEFLIQFLSQPCFFFQTIAMNTFLSNDVGNGASVIETLIGWYAEDAENGCFSVGNRLSYADLFIYELAKNYLPKTDEFIARYPRIYRVRDSVEKNESIVNFFKDQPIEMQTQSIELPEEPSAGKIETGLETKQAREV